MGTNTVSEVFVKILIYVVNPLLMFFHLPDSGVLFRSKGSTVCLCLPLYDSMRSLRCTSSSSGCRKSSCQDNGCGRKSIALGLRTEAVSLLLGIGGNITTHFYLVASDVVDRHDTLSRRLRPDISAVVYAAGVLRHWHDLGRVCKVSLFTSVGIHNWNILSLKGMM